MVGESGCGKTIMALAVLGLLPPGCRRAAGWVLLDGRDLTAISRRELAAIRGRGIGYVAQDPMASLDPTFTVGAQISEAIRAHGKVSRADSRRRAVQLLNSVNIPDPAEAARRYPHQLSGGMQQRVRDRPGPVRDPDLLIADEPTTALDVTIQAEILRCCAPAGPAAHGHPADHPRLGVATRAADRVVVMYAGEVAEAASMADLIAGPDHPYARALLASDPLRAVPGQPLPVITGSVPAPGSWPAWCRFEPRCPEAGPECQAGPVDITVTAPGHQARCLHARPAAEVRA